ncbi:PREDICTED: luc7-like protein 3 [Habropoda laboriosa]|uniref:luc7-like protein 3 n=1 Tax=Habropoda laboriosa TaxID=597456 RepID=UPI00083E4E04|nr:PREDICTED: luc7-like protein 3 [Habropoda laboriosa]
MVNASKPRLMNRVLDAVVHLCEGKGSTVRDVLDFLRQTSKSTPRNLTVQVHRALKHAVNAGLLRHRSGRYKALFTLNPAPSKQPANENDDEKSVEETNAFDERQQPSRVNSDDAEESREKQRRQRRERRRKRTPSRQRKRRRHSGSRKRDGNTSKHIGEIRKPKHKETEERARSPRHKISESRFRVDIGNASSSSNRNRSKPRSRDRTYYSDLSDSSDYEGRKAKGRKRTQVCQDCKRHEGGKSRKRSASRNRSPKRRQSQQLQLKNSHEDDNSNKFDTDDHRNDEIEHDTENHELDKNESGSTL